MVALYRKVIWFCIGAAYFHNAATQKTEGQGSRCPGGENIHSCLGKLWQLYFMLCTLHHNNVHQRGPQVCFLQCKAHFNRSACGCNRGSLRYSQFVRYAHQMFWKNWHCVTLRTSDIPQGSIESCKLMCNMNFSRVQFNMLWCVKCMFVCTMWYSLVWKMNVRMWYVICLGMHNQCLYVSCNVLWCEK